MKIDIIEYLSSLPQDEIIYYYPNPGNGGDSLISCATFQLFQKIGIKYQITDCKKQSFTNKIFIYAGGGNLVSYYHDASDVLNKVIEERPKKLIILPHSINENEDLLRRFDANVDIVCREFISYQFVKKIASQANVLLADDMAFCLNGKEIVSKNFLFLLAELMMTYRNISQFLYILKMIKRYVKKMPYLPRKNKMGILNAFRTDVEKTNISTPEDNVDLSDVLTLGVSPEPVAIMSTYFILSIIDQFKEIRTDRLHIAIAGTILGKQVFLYPNSYFKNEAIYKNSIKDRFPTVHWMGN